MARKPTKSLYEKKKPDIQPAVLKGWKQIADFLGQPMAVAQDLSRWLGREIRNE
jgi:hypothetical protein